MTALAGIWDFHGRSDPSDSCARMLAAQSIYGGHGEQRWSEGNVALGRRLWRLLPEDSYDTQPLRGGESNLVLVADLRLDNREELAGELGMPAAQARMMCDAALLLAAFERWDEGCCGHLVGDYAFAVWDARNQRLVLARDLMGFRPLHYHRGETFFAFASMPKGLHALPEVPRAPDEERIAEFLALLPEYGSSSFYKGVERVEAGQVVTITHAGIRARRHWQWERRTLTLRSPGEYVEAMRNHLDQAVRSQLRGADGRVAAHLSAGLDSSAVATTAARLLAPGGGKVIAFTAVPPAGYCRKVPQDRLADEGSHAAATAAMHLNIEHVPVESGHRPLLDPLDHDFYLYDRPLLSLCTQVGYRAVNDEIRARNLGVLLTGTMGNVTISYDGAQLLAELFRAGRLRKWARTVAVIAGAGYWRPRATLTASFGPWCPPLLWQFLCRLVGGHSFDIGRYSAINPSRLSDLAARAHALGLDFTYRRAKDGLALRLYALQDADLGNYNKGTLARWGIDIRDPTADRRLLEFCLSVPTEEFFRDGVPRALARSALADRVPVEVLNETRRGMQGADWHETLTAARPQIADEISRLEKNAPAVRALDLPRLRRLVENWPTEGWHREDIIEPYRLALLRAVSVGHFLRRASGGNA